MATTIHLNRLPDGRERRVEVTPHDVRYLHEVRVYVCHVYNGGVVHVGSGTTPDMAEETALSYAARSLNKRDLKKLRDALRAGTRGQLVVLPPGITHFGFGPGGSSWAGSKGVTSLALEYRDGWQVPGSKHERCTGCTVLLMDADGRRVEWVEHDRYCDVKREVAS